MKYSNILILLSLISFCFLNFSTSNIQAQSLEDFTLLDTQGNEHHLYQYLEEGEVVVLNFFFTTCGYCSAFAPKLQEVYEGTGEGEDGVKIFSLEVQNATDEEIDQWQSQRLTDVPAMGGDLVWNYWADNVYPILGGGFTQVIILAPNQEDPAQSPIVYSKAGSTSSNTAGEMMDTIAKYKVEEIVDTGLDDLSEITNNELILTSKASPNPSKDFIQLQIEVKETQNAPTLIHPTLIQVFNLQGQLIKEIEEQALQQGENTFDLNIENLNTGTYLIQITSEEISQTLKIKKI